MFKKISFMMLLFFCSCCPCGGGRISNRDIVQTSYRHEDRLREYFINGRNKSDVSVLITETRMISRELRNANMPDRARRFDSYTDVLMYGNNAIDESLRDVQDLIYLRRDSIDYRERGRGFFCELKSLFCEPWC